MAKAKKPAALTKQQAHKAVEVAEAMARREKLTSADRHWLVDLLMNLANDALEYRPKHRSAKNADRNFYLAMDQVLTGDLHKIVAHRWGLSEVTVRQIVSRMRRHVDSAVAGSSASPAILLRVVAWHRDRSARSSVTKDLRKA